jgi:hypothetical protein
MERQRRTNPRFTRPIPRRFIHHPFRGSLILLPSLPPRGRARDRLDHVGRERRPRRSGPEGASDRTLLLSWPGLTGPPSTPGAAGGYWVPRSRFARRGMTLETSPAWAVPDSGPDRPGGLLRHPSGTTTGAPWRLKKRGMETFRRRVGAPVRRDFTIAAPSRRSLTPRPVPDSSLRPGGGATGPCRVA